MSSAGFRIHRACLCGGGARPPAVAKAIADKAGRVFQREPARSTTDYPEHTDKTKDNEQKFSADSANEIPGPTFLVFIRGKLFRRLGLIRGTFV